MTMKHNTREQWLMAGLELLKPLFTSADAKVPKKIRVSCGFPSRSALSVKRTRIGECWSDKASGGNYFEIFVSPLLNDPVRVLDVLTHEVVHAVVGLECGHKKPFRKVALAVGLTGKMTATVAGPQLTERINGIVKQLGTYPHDQLNKMTTGKPKKDKCRLLKAACPGCGYTIRVTRKWIDEAGLPACPCGEQLVEE